MRNAWVAAVAGDIGGARELLPAMQIVGGRRVRWFVDPGPQARAGLVLDVAGVPYERRFPEACDDPAVIVVGTSATSVDAQIAWTEFGLAKSISVYWVEDLFGTGSRACMHATAPDVMLTIHPLAEGIARRVRPDLVTKTVGKPSFARIPALVEKRNEMRANARRHLYLGKEFLVHWIFAGDPAPRPWKQIECFARAERKLSALGAVMMPRFHPKHLENDRLKASMKEILGDQFVEPALGIDEAISASDLVIADWGSTDAFTSLFLDIPVATTLFPDDADARADAGFAGGIPPVLVKYEDWGLSRADDIYERAGYVKSHREVALFITRSRAGKFSGMCDPGAAKRIADEISAHLK